MIGAYGIIEENQSSRLRRISAGIADVRSAHPDAAARNETVVHVFEMTDEKTVGRCSIMWWE